jgi:hypothetical protein
VCACPIVLKLDVSADNGGELVEAPVGVDDPEVIKSVLVVDIERLTERTEDGLECIVVPRREKLAGDNVRIADIPGRVDCLVVIRIAVIDVGLRIAHSALHTTGYQALIFRAYRNWG